MKTRKIVTGLLASMLGTLTACGQLATMPEGKLLNVEYTESGTMAGFQFEGRVNTGKNGVVRMEVSSESYGPVVKKKVNANVLDDLRKIIEEEKMYAYKENYQPSFEVLDGESWYFNAAFENDKYISSGGSNAWPAGDGLKRIKGYLQSLIGDSKPAETNSADETVENKE